MICLGQNRAVVTSRTANLWAEPDSDAEVLTTFIRDSELTVDADRRRNGFYFANSNGRDGWVRGEKLDIKVREPSRNTVWLFIGKTERQNGLSIVFHLNVTQLIRNGDRVKFWTKAVPDVKSLYLEQLRVTRNKKETGKFEYSTDLWEGNCKTDMIRVRRTLLHWSDGEIIRFNLTKQKREAASGSAGKVILKEACKIGKK